MANYADLIQRGVAVIIDTVILMIVAAVIGLAFMGPMFMAASMPYAAGVADPMIFTGMMSFAGIMILLWIVYFTYFEGTTGQTPGKKLLNIKVVKENGKQPNYADALIRNILRIIDAMPTVYILGIILVAVSEKKQRLGDMAAKTLVVKA